jgi:hypothetical protein
MNTRSNGKTKAGMIVQPLLAVAGAACSVFRNRKSTLETKVSDAKEMKDNTNGESAEGKSSVLTTMGILLVAVVVLAVLISFVLGPSGAPPPNPEATTNTSQSPGEVRITVVNPDNVDSLILVGPDGIRSTVLSSGFQKGAEITLRSNATVHSYLEDNSVKIPANGGGFITIETPRDITTTQLSLQEADLSDTDYAPRTAYLACLYETSGGFELDGKSIPSNVSIPCHSPVLAQAERVQNGTSIRRNGDTVTTPIILKEGEYYLVGSLDGQEDVVESFEVSEETAGQ